MKSEPAYAITQRRDRLGRRTRAGTRGSGPGGFSAWARLGWPFVLHLAWTRDVVRSGLETCLHHQHLMPSTPTTISPTKRTVPT